jgi:hypothetical protein
VEYRRREKVFLAQSILRNVQNRTCWAHVAHFCAPFGGLDGNVLELERDEIDVARETPDGSFVRVISDAGEIGKLTAGLSSSGVKMWTR